MLTLNLLAFGFFITIGLAEVNLGSRFLTYREYLEKKASSPYKVYINNSFSELVYIGINHTSDTEDDQIKFIIENWENLKPDVALNEGGLWKFGQDIETTISQYGEAGLVSFLANRDQIPVLSLEPPDSVVINYLRNWFTNEQIKVFSILQYIPQYFTLSQGESFEVYVARAIHVLSQKPGLEGFPRNVAELSQSIKALLPRMGDWRKVDNRWISPLKDFGFTNDIARRTNEIKNQEMVNKILNIFKSGGKIFAVGGLSHVVMQEPALKEAQITK